MPKRHRPVYFQHIQKTGGTSIIDTLRLFFHDDRVANSKRLLVEGGGHGHVPRDAHVFDFVADHSDILSGAPDNAFTFAVFREPLSRLLSARRQYMQARDENLAIASPEVVRTVLALRNSSMVEMIHRAFEFPKLVSSVWNHQTISLGMWPLIRETLPRNREAEHNYMNLDRYFESGQALRLWLSTNSGEILRRASQTLKSLSYVGLTAHLDTSTHEIFARIGLPEPGQVVVRNARQAFPDEHDPDIPEAATEFLALDYELYALAQELFDRQCRMARGLPIDYIGRWLSVSEPTRVSCREPPGGHGWYPAHIRGDGSWARWTGPDLESRFVTAAEPGRYRMTLEVYGAASGRSLQEMQVVVDAEPLGVQVAQLATGMYTVTARFERAVPGRFEIVFKCPDIGMEYGLEIARLIFAPLDPSE